jgi:hypothetical protein
MDSQIRNALEKTAFKARMTHIKEYIDSLQNTANMHDAVNRLQLLEKLWEEYNAVQDHLEFNNETQQHELDREAFTETYCKWRARIDRIFSEVS